MTPDEALADDKDIFKSNFPVFYEAAEDFFLDTATSEKDQLIALDCLLACVHHDLPEINDSELLARLQIVNDTQTKYIGDIIAFLFAHARQKTVTKADGSGHRAKTKKFKTGYFKDYVMDTRKDTSDETSAYEEEEYLQIVYYTTNAEYIKENDMYRKAAMSKKYADTWLFLALHCICALRFTSMEEIYHPRLKKEPEEILNSVKNGTFTEADGKQVSTSLMDWMHHLGKAPKKTRSHSGVPLVKFFIPISLEAHYGELFAICEAHHQLAGLTDQDPLIHKISDYSQISRYMGEEIGDLFLYRNFRSRKMNKSYLQSLEMFSDDILQEHGIASSKAYMIASMARSHKGGYGRFATTTAEYLKDATFSGMSAEVVAHDLFERGVLSSVVSMLLKIVTNGEYDDLSPKEQTRYIQLLDMNAAQAEALVRVTDQAQKRAVAVVNETLATLDSADPESIKNVLHKLAIGDAPAKEEGILCVRMALSGACPYKGQTPCIGCQYEVGTKSSAYHLASEFARLKGMYDTASSPLERDKYKWILQERVLPFLDEMIQCMGVQYGPEYVEEFSNIVKENLS